MLLRAKAYSRHLAFTELNDPSLLREKLLSLLKKCPSTKTVQQIHTQMLINFIQKPNFLLIRIIDLKDFNYASLLFHQISRPNEYAFNVMIRGLTTAWQKYSHSLKLYYQMKRLGLKPDNFTYPFVFISCANLLALNHGVSVHSSVFKIGLDEDDHVSHSLITMYARCGKLDSARKVFDEIRERDLVSWNSMISGYSKMGYAKEAVELFGRMREEEFLPDEITLVSVLGSCGDLGDLVLGKWVEGFVVKNKMDLNFYMGSALIDMYGKFNPDKITLIGVLSACASIGALDLGKWVDKYASQRGLRHDIFVATALIDMYAKCGSIDDALKVFEDMPVTNEVSWNAMISALAFNGRAHEALLLFKRMSKEGGAAHPNDVTFIGVLSACVHAGLVDEGRRLFDLMSSSFGLIPKSEHYSCMVDLYARAGHLSEAWDFVERMPEKVDEIVLGALLGACQKQKNTDVSQRVMQLLLEIESSNSGNYVISSKIFANLKMWDDSAKMRALMREKGVSKTPGCSWIGIDDPKQSNWK
ncbi:pentatricopeptide repeat-containing protein [Citrus sinensis]|uniref:Pentatricopeptide repeat-containing protein n=1 Tax=Citrus sinensis TaxID=2711 RepID=A0ACB8P777_CITSI|nr:pentatricopeptide repeat-containing protein [Citrus sinensis]